MENTRELAKQVRSSAADSVKLIKAAKRLSPAKQLEQGSENLNNASKAMTELSRHKRDAQAQEDFRRHSSKYEEVVAKERSFIERASSKVSIKNLGDKIQLVPQVARWNDETKVLNVDVQRSSREARDRSLTRERSATTPASTNNHAAHDEHNDSREAGASNYGWGHQRTDIPIVPLASSVHRVQSNSSSERASSFRGNSNGSTHRSSSSITRIPFKGGSDLSINQSMRTTRTGDNPFRGGSEEGSSGSNGSIRSTATGNNLYADRAFRRSSKSSRKVPRVNTNPFDDFARRT